MSVWKREFFTLGSVPKRHKTKGYPDYLQQRHWDSVSAQAKAALDSWMGLCEDEFRRIVVNSSLGDEMKHSLFCVNLAHSWYFVPDYDTYEVKDETHKPKKGEKQRKRKLAPDEQEWDAQVRWLARQIMRQVRKRASFPDLSKCRTMNMDGKIAQVEEPTNAFHWQWWVRVTTLEPRKPVRIPFDADPRMAANIAENGENVCNHLQVRIGNDGEITYRFMTDREKEAARDDGFWLAADWGLKCLFVTNYGDQYGQRMYDWLVARDAELIALQKELQKQDIKPNDSKRYRNLNKRIRDYFVNEVNRVLNRLSARGISELVVEDLDFRFGGLSKKMNRLLSRAGRGAVERKIQDLENNHGIVVTKVNPAYTSQQCSRCGYVNKNNRKTRDRFECGCCHHSASADTNGAVVVGQRRSRPDGWRKVRRSKILDVLLREHAERCPNHPIPSGACDGGNHAVLSMAPSEVNQTSEV